MTSLSKKIEVVANVAIIVVALLLGVVLIRGYLLPRSRVQPPKAASIAAGTRLSLAGIDWKVKKRTLVMALSTQCHFCTDSAEFYQRVAKEKTLSSDLRLVAVFPQPVEDAREYMAHLGFHVDEIKQTPLSSLGVNGTPTLIMTDSDGIVSDLWTGKLPSDKESEVLNRLH